MFINLLIEMSSSKQSQNFKMIFTLAIVSALLASTNAAKITNLLDLPLTMPKGSSMIHATLTDSDGTAKYFIQEYISAPESGKIKGKIMVTSSTETYSIFYSTNDTDGTDTQQRLVMAGTSCALFSYKNSKWDTNLPEVTKTITNTLLLMGPSILYRLDHGSITWAKNASKNVRGTKMEGLTATINDKLSVTYYYKTNLDSNSGLLTPSRIEFSSSDGTRSKSTVNNLILDIYIQDEDYKDRFVNDVQPTPGVGCPKYLIDDLTIPKLEADFVHFIMYEYLQGSITTQTYSEIHASDKTQLLRLKASLLGIETEALYDYSLGIAYILEENGFCSAFAGEMTSPGIGTNGSFSIENLFLLNADFKYLGPINYEHRSGFSVKVWEAILYGATINGKQADKIVISQYFAESENGNVFDGYSLVGTTVAYYKLDTSRTSYTFSDGITRDYLDFQTAGFEDEYHDMFTLRECPYLIGQDELTLTFKIDCFAMKCIEFAQKHIYQFKQQFVNSIISYPFLPVSRLRVDDIEARFDDSEIYLDVTFLETVDVSYIYNVKSMFVSETTLAKLKTYNSYSESDCIERISEMRATYEVVIYNPSDSICGTLDTISDVIEDVKSGKACNVYHFPMHNLPRLKKEIELSGILYYLKLSTAKTFYLDNRPRDIVSYSILDIVEKSTDEIESNGQLFTRIGIDEKLKEDGKTTLIVPEITTFADCYRACANSDDLACNTFSFCLSASSVECRVSSSPSRNITVEDKSDTNCAIYSKNALNGYTKVSNRKFKTQTSTSMRKGVNDCAAYCFANDECLSFQNCAGSCTFGGAYTDKDTRYSEECDIYYPKVSKNYQVTGDKIISESFVTEMNLNLDQCAALCDSWSDDGVGCVSFNYCPKSRSTSSCSLTKYSVKSSNAPTLEGSDCSNYELTSQSNGNKQSSTAQLGSITSGSSAFGIIMLFLFAGLIMGVAVPFGYAKVQSIRNNDAGIVKEINERFVWSRQVDEQVENVH